MVANIKAFPPIRTSMTRKSTAHSRARKAQPKIEFANRLARQIAIEFDGCHAANGSLDPQIAFPAVVRNPFDFPLTVFVVEGGITIVHPKQGNKFIAPLRRIATMEPPHPMGIAALDLTHENFVAQLNWRLIDEIERIRDGSELVLRAKMQFLCAQLEDKSANPGILKMFWILGEATKARSGELRFSHREWLDVLSKWGYANRRILEMTLPNLEGLRKNFEGALAHLDTADRHVWAGHYDDALVAARKCLESLKSAIDGVIDDLEKQGGMRHQKFTKFRKAVHEMTDVGAHIGRPTGRAEALLVVTTVKEWLAFCGSEGVF